MIPWEAASASGKREQGRKLATNLTGIAPQRRARLGEELADRVLRGREHLAGRQVGSQANDDVKGLLRFIKLQRVAKEEDNILKNIELGVRLVRLVRRHLTIEFEVQPPSVRKSDLSLGKLDIKDVVLGLNIGAQVLKLAMCRVARRPGKRTRGCRQRTIDRRCEALMNIIRTTSCVILRLRPHSRRGRVLCGVGSR